MSWLEDLDGIIREEEADNESSIKVFRDSSVESSSESEDFLIVVDVLEEVSLWLVWQKFVNISE